MRFDLITIFPDYFASFLAQGVVGRAAAAGLLQVVIHNLRDYAPAPHHITDDRPFGGGEGMVMKPEPIYHCLAAILGREPGRAEADEPTRVYLLSAQGARFDQACARRLARLERLVLICGRYEGVDERIAENYVDNELSIGDFVLSGGELPAALVLDAVGRLVPGVLGDAQSAINESFAAEAPTQLDCPHYTRPIDFRGHVVPEVLRQGNHAAIAQWRGQQALRKTERRAKLDV
ncbi:MAG TPA: tRNA (guanosine(37)-N1)-methyltransferase TrmD [Terriglobales bacterium]|nr:tRNA (guanosine(37)-N1)-methyltransferase TrmD [Terriglobales bacterium]